MVTQTPATTRRRERTGLQDHISELESRLRELEKVLSDLTEREQAHLRTQQNDARDYLHRGETLEMVVVDSNLDSGKVLSKIEGIYTFIDPKSFDVSDGDVIAARIVDVGDSHAEALALEKVCGGTAQ